MFSHHQLLDYAPGDELVTAAGTESKTTPLHLAVSHTTTDYSVCVFVYVALPSLPSSPPSPPLLSPLPPLSPPSSLLSPLPPLSPPSSPLLPPLLSSLPPPSSLPSPPLSLLPPLLQAYHGHFGVLEELLYKYQQCLDWKDDKGI